MATDADAKWVDCPTCSASAGADCTGGPIHPGRRALAARELV